MMDGPVAALHGDSREPMHRRCDRGSGLPMKRGGAAQGRTSVDNTGQRNDAAVPAGNSGQGATASLAFTATSAF
jgi:hypothetical protein